MKNIWRLILGVVLLGLVYLVLKEIDFVELYYLILNLNLFYFILAIFTLFVSFIFWNYRTMYAMKSIIPHPDYKFFFHVLFAGVFINTVTPGARIGGEPLKAHFIGKKYNKSKMDVLGGVIADKLFHILVSLVFVIFSVFYAITYINISKELTWILEGFLVFFLIVGLLVAFFNLRKSKFNFVNFFGRFHFLWFVKKKFPDKKDLDSFLKKRVMGFGRVFKKIMKDKKIALVSVLLSFGVWIFYYLVYYLLFLAFGVNVNLLLVLVVVNIGILIGDATPFPGGIGFIEGSMILLYSAVGISFALATTVVFLGRIIFYFYALFVGGLSLLYLENKLK